MQNLAMGGLEGSFASPWQKPESNSFAILQTPPWRKRKKEGYKPSWKENIFAVKLHGSYIKRAFQVARLMHSVIQNTFLNVVWEDFVFSEYTLSFN